MTTILLEHLQLHALTLQQLEAYLQGAVPLAKHLGLLETELEVAPEFWAEVPQAIEQICIPKVKEHPEHAAWYTHWVMVLPSDNRLVGGIGLSGLPDEKGQVYTGYYVDDRYSGKGFATEALLGLTAWAFLHPTTQAVVADTLVDGWASQRVLQKAGFVFDQNTEEGNLRWRLARERHPAASPRPNRLPNTSVSYQIPLLCP